MLIYKSLPFGDDIHIIHHDHSTNPSAVYPERVSRRLQGTLPSQRASIMILHRSPAPFHSYDDDALSAIVQLEIYEYKRGVVSSFGDLLC